ncbi:alanine racemase C-terminal domain-containing protein [uncultured Microbacterium sp.]|uniref:alanine racemase C-terminal domain-containing protein n=1 Tax=uncultured Microbacterium sp. TaxID=191216 RepID=UPI0035CC8DE9
MIEAERGQGAPADGIRPRSTPVARIALDVLAANASALGGTGSVADLRADAWGHGVAHAARVILDAGVDSVIVDSADRAGVLVSGIDSGRVLVEGRGTIDQAVLFGLPGGGTAPVMRLRGSVLGVKPLRAGEGVSYGYAHRAPSDTHAALVAGGYAQGIVRELGGLVDVAIRGAQHPIIGRIAMDACVIDVGDADVDRGDAVWFFGDTTAGEPSLADWVAATGWTAAELVTAVGRLTMREHTS